MGCAFVDELLIQKPETKVVMVDRRNKPGGHWASHARDDSLVLDVRVRQAASHIAFTPVKEP